LSNDHSFTLKTHKPCGPRTAGLMSFLITVEFFTVIRRKIGGEKGMCHPKLFFNLPIPNSISL